MLRRSAVAENAQARAGITLKRLTIVIAVLTLLSGVLLVFRPILFPETSAGRAARIVFEAQFEEFFDATPFVYERVDDERIRGYMIEDGVFPEDVGYPVDQEEYAEYFFIEVRATRESGGNLHFGRDYYVLRPKGSLTWEVHPSTYPR